MPHLGTTETVKLLGFVLVAVAVYCAVLGSASNAASLGARYWTQYTSWLERSLRAMFIFTSGKRIATMQLAIGFAVAIAGIGLGISGWYVALLLVAVGPRLWIQRMQAKRTEAADAQLPTFLSMLGSALRVTPSIGAALQSLVGTLEPPFRDEVSLALKQFKIGCPLDQALIGIAVRLKSNAADAAISTILIGREVGGGLPKTLDTSATSLRELQRLEGVVKSKTADGKNQLMLLTFMPVVALVGFEKMSPGFFQPLTTSVVGGAIAAGAALTWTASLFWARKIIAVDV